MQIQSAIAKFTNRRRVSMADTDSSGTVHLGAYIRMMEETEYAFLRSRGLSVVLTDAKGIMGFPRLEASIDIAHPARFDEELQIELNLIKVDGKQVSTSSWSKVWEAQLTLCKSPAVASA